MLVTPLARPDTTEPCPMNEHTSKNFDLELEKLRTRVLEMGGLAEAQVRQAIAGLYSGDKGALETVIRTDDQVNRMEIDIDALCNQIIAKRQPTAIDLRMIVSVLKAVSDIERIGDKARKIARLALEIHAQNQGAPNVELRHMADTSLTMLRLALDAFARLDVNLVGEALRLDATVNSDYRGLARQLITYMMEDPRTITRSLDIMSVAKSIERIGDHASNIAQHVVYMVKGENVQHATPDEIAERIARP